MHTTKLTKRINTITNGLLSDQILTKLNNIDDSFNYDVVVIDSFEELLKTHMSKNIRFVNNEIGTTKESIYNVYDIYISNGNLTIGELKVVYYANSPNSNTTDMIKKVEANNLKNSICIYIVEKTSKALSETIAVTQTIYIYLS